ncbi:MAG: hypothetical protein J6328_03640, partial [Bacilli bacterium]|nr:hypothetical protein [Bacilli bacterium]
KEYAILNSDGEVVSTGVETGKTISSWGGSETTYGTEMVAKAHLAVGSYTLKIGYSELPTSWTSMKFKGVVLHEGDEPENALDGRITLGVPSILQGSVEGKWYKLTSSAANYLIMQLDGAPSGMKVALYDAAGTTKIKEVSSVGSSLFYKTASDTDYLVYVYGASGEATLMFSRVDSYETGEKKEEALSLNGSLKDVTQFVGKTIWLKFTTGEAGLYKLFTRSLLGGGLSSGNGNDSKILGLYTADSDTAVGAASGPTDDDKHAHNETGGNYDTYAEYNLEASTTYFVKLSLGSTNTSYDVVKFGVRGNEPGDSKDSALAADLSGNSFSGSFSEIGTWYQFTTSSAESLSLSFSGLEGAKATIYNSSLSKVGEVASGASDPLVAVLGSETLYYLVLSGASGEANIALGHESAPDYSIANIRGVNGDNSDNGSVITIHEGLGWVATENDGELKSNIADINYGRAAYKMTVTVAGTVSFSWASSGEKGYDYLMVFVNGQEVIGKADNPAPVASYADLAWHDFTRELAAGDEISIVFRKDSSGKGGLDAAFIKNFSFAVVE